MDVCEESPVEAPDVAPETPPTYIVEMSKSGRAECKKCDCKIEKKTIRVGVLVEGEWGLFTRWQHLDCTVFRGVEEVEGLDGYLELNAAQKAEVAERVRASADEQDEDNVPVEPDELVRKSWEQPLEPSSDLLMPLLAYQKEGLGWMVNQEQNDSHGGILADEMGMGKTIQAIALMLHNRPNFSDFAQMREWAASDERHSHGGSGGSAELTKACTLIVLPTVAIRQWQTEIARFTRGGSLTVKVYHGSDRNTTVQDLTTADVVLTSYKILEIEYRKATAGTKVTCRLCGKKFYPDKLRVHRKYFCGETAQRTEAQSLTQKKKQRVMLPGSTGVSSSVSGAKKQRGRGAAGAMKCEDSDEESDGSEDSIAQQKRQNKEQAEKKERAAAARREKRAAKASAAKAEKAEKASLTAVSTTGSAAKGRGRATSAAAGKAAKPAAKKGSAAASAAASGKDGSETESEEVAWESATDVDSEQDGDSGNRPVLKPSGKTSKMSEVRLTPASKSNAKSAVTVKTEPKAPVSASKRATATPVSGKKASAAAKFTTPAATATTTASASDGDQSDAEASSGPPAKRRSPRTQAQVPRQYFAEPQIELGSDEDGVGSVDSGGDGAGADAESEYGGSDGGKESQDEAGGSGDSGTGSEDASDAPTSDSETGAAGRGAKRAGSGRGGTKSPASAGKSKSSAASKAAGKLPTPRGKASAAKVSPVSKRAAKAAAAKGSARGKRPANPFGRPPTDNGAGRKRGRAAVESDQDESDASDAAEDAVDSASDSDSGSDVAGAGTVQDGLDEEVERDIQAALAEAAKLRSKSKQAPAQSILHLVSWFRIILDEAHLIKDRSTSTAKAVFNLVSLNKWCLTGTPLQNRVGELYSLIRFLRIDPHAYYYCRTKGCSCKSLHYRFTQSKCDDCGHSVIQHFCHFNKHILNPIKRSGYVSEGRKAMLKLKNQVLDEILLRRTKMTRAEDIQLPPRIVRVRQERLDVKEEDFYSALYTQSQAQFNTYLQSGTVLNNYAHIFDILIRLRQAVDHPYLVIYSDAQTAAKKDCNMFLTGSLTGGGSAADMVVDNTTVVTSVVEVKAEKGDCDLCHEPWEDPVSAQCGHTFCRACITDYIDAMSPARTVGAMGAAALSAGASPAAKSAASKRSSSRNSAAPSPPKPAPSADRSSSGSNGTAAVSVTGVRCPDCDRALTICLDAANSASTSKRRAGGAVAAAAADEAGKQIAECEDEGDVGNGEPGNGDGVSVWDASKSLSRKSILDRIDLNLFQSSTKIEALMEELHRMQVEDLGAKAIVFSQFVNMLDLINFRLQRGGLGCVKLSGSMNLEQRDRAITAFKTDPAVKVMLISLKAGGVALNLTVASRIFLMDPWWNPAAEMQAIDRTHRIGQYKPIYATRFIIDNTIEERILRLQEKKKLVFDGTVGGDAGSMSKLTVDDMRFLFN